MKALKLSFVALALVAGVGAAVVSNAGNGKVKAGTTYFWFDASGNYVQTNTIEDEKSASDCDETTEAICENGYLASQLNNSSVPSQGVQVGQTPNKILHVRP